MRHGSRARDHAADDRARGTGRPGCTGRSGTRAAGLAVVAVAVGATARRAGARSRAHAAATASATAARRVAVHVVAGATAAVASCRRPSTSRRATVPGGQRLAPLMRAAELGVAVVAQGVRGADRRVGGAGSQRERGGSDGHRGAGHGALAQHAPPVDLALQERRCALGDTHDAAPGALCPHRLLPHRPDLFHQVGQHGVDDDHSDAARSTRPATTTPVEPRSTRPSAAGTGPATAAAAAITADPTFTTTWTGLRRCRSGPEATAGRELPAAGDDHDHGERRVGQGDADGGPHPADHQAGHAERDLDGADGTRRSVAARQTEGAQGRPGR